MYNAITSYYSLNESLLALHEKVAKIDSEYLTFRAPLGSEKDYNFTKYLCPDRYEEYLKDKFHMIFPDKKIDFTNLETFTEKIQALKIWDQSEQKTLMSDKVLVRDFVSNIIGSDCLVPQIGVYDNFDDIGFSELPNSFIIKTNHGSGGNIIVKSKSDLDIDSARTKINFWMSRNHAWVWGLELCYKDIQPKIIIEELLEFEEGIEDYKFYCFNGKPRYMLVIADRHANEKMAFYDMNFNKQDFSILDGMSDMDIDKPIQFDLMLELTNKLLDHIDTQMVRIDWYITRDGRVLFGEITFYPGSGYYHFEPQIYDKIWGDMIDISNIVQKKEGNPTFIRIT